MDGQLSKGSVARSEAVSRRDFSEGPRHAGGVLKLGDSASAAAPRPWLAQVSKNSTAVVRRPLMSNSACEVRPNWSMSRSK